MQFKRHLSAVGNLVTCSYAKCKCVFFLDKCFHFTAFGMLLECEVAVVDCGSLEDHVWEAKTEKNTYPLLNQAAISLI